MRAEKTIENFCAGVPSVIVAFGDSLSYGWMVHKGYLAFFKEMICETYPESDFTIINRGVPGDTAHGGLHRLEWDVFRHDPDCVLLQFALNDAFVGYSPAQYRENIEAIITGIREKCHSEIVLVTSVCLGSERENAFIETFYEQLDDLARLYRLPIARVHEYWKKRILEGVRFKGLVQFDAVHPTSDGYKLMAEAVMKVFV